MQSKCLVSVSHKDESTRPETPTGRLSNITGLSLSLSLFCVCVCWRKWGVGSVYK